MRPAQGSTASGHRTIILLMELPPTVYMRKRWPEQAFWNYARVRRDVPHALRCLTDQDRIFMGSEGARRALDYLRGLGFEDDATDNHMMPVMVVDEDGHPVSLPDLAPAA